MIDWALVGSAGVWLSGAALLLAGASYGYWEAQAAGRPLRAWLAEQTWWRRLYPAALCLICLGLGLASASWWEKAAWAGLLAASLWEVIQTWRRR